MRRSCFDGNRGSQDFVILVRKVSVLDTMCLVMKDFLLVVLMLKKSRMNEVYVWLFLFVSPKSCVL